MSNDNSDYFTEMVKLIVGLGIVAIVVLVALTGIAGMFGSAPEQDQAAINDRLKAIEVVSLVGEALPKAVEKKAVEKAPEAAKTSTESKPSTETKTTEVAAGDAGMGKMIYTKTCFACHGTGILESPKLGDKAVWKKRLDAAGGIDGLVKSAIAGKGAMPPNGGASGLTADDLKATIEYMMQ